MNLLRYSVLILVLCNVPTFTLFYISPTLGSIMSYLSLALMALYYFFAKQKGKLILPFIFLGFSYYIISGLDYVADDAEMKNYFISLTKFILVIICGSAILRNTNLKEFYVILIFGSLSVITHAMFFPTIDVIFGDSYGRFSGFYLNPNTAAVISLAGFSLSFGINNVKLKLFGQLVFSLAGILTLSRYFIATWVLLNVISVIINKKNSIVPLIGVVVLIFIVSYSSSSFKLNSGRFEALQSIFSKTERTQTGTITNNSRTETWAQYYDIILNKPLLGNGYKKLQGGAEGLKFEGVHNTYLRVLGEAGIIPFLILIWIISNLLIKGYQSYKSELHYFFLSIVITTFLLVSHTFFESFSYIFVTLFLYLQLNIYIDENNENKSNN